MSAGEGDTQKLTYHEGLAEVEEMKRAMLETVCRYCLAALIVAFSLAAMIALAHSRFWSLLQEHAKGW